MSRFTLSIIIYSLLVISLAVGISCLIILRPLRSDLNQVSKDQASLKQELTTDLSEIKSTLEVTNLKLETRANLSLESDLTETTLASNGSSLVTDSKAAQRLNNINSAIDSALAELDTPVAQPAVGGLQKKVTVTSPKWTAIEVYASPNPSALTVGTVRYGTDYPVIDSQLDWYQITIPGGTQGWVMATYVKEVN